MPHICTHFYIPIILCYKHTTDAILPLCDYITQLIHDSLLYLFFIPALSFSDLYLRVSVVEYLRSFQI